MAESPMSSSTTSTDGSVSLRFTPQQLLELNDALVERPFKVAAPLIASINEQIRAQRAPLALVSAKSNE